MNQRSQPPSNQKFGLFFAFVFAMLAAYYYYEGRHEVAIFAVIAAGIFAISALIAPQILTPLNILWNKLGVLLGRVVSPMVLCIIFFFLITPISLIMRMCGRDELRLRPRSVDSYWIDRDPPGPEKDSFKNQF